MKMMKKLAALLLVLVSLCAAACAEELPEVGSIVVFGSYEQDNDLTNGMEPIEWIVLDRNEETNQAFLISRLCLDNKIYYHLRVSRYWANSTLREWMNGEFFQTIFINRRNTALHQFYFIFIDIHTGNIMSHFCKTDTCYESYITGSGYCNFHTLFLLSFIRIPFGMLLISAKITALSEVNFPHA